MWIGIGAAVAYLASWVVAMLSDLLFGADGEPIWLFPVELLVDGLAAVPFVIAVNRLNGDRPENQKRNSAISRWDAMGVATSLIFLISTAYLSYDEAQLVAEAEAYSAAP